MKPRSNPRDAARRQLSKMVLPAAAELNRLADRWLEERLKLHGVSLAEFRIVGALLGEDTGLSQRELAGRLGVRPATVSGILPQLERKGLIEKIGNPKDARANLVRLQEIRHKLEPVLAIVEELERLLFEDVSPDDRSRLRDLLANAAGRIEPKDGSSP